MPYDQVMHKWKHGLLHSGSKHGKVVKNQKQAVAIMLSEKRKADSGDEEYAPKHISPSVPAFNHMMDRVKNKSGKKSMFKKRAK